MATSRAKVTPSTRLLDDPRSTKVKPYCPVTVEPIVLLLSTGMIMAVPLQQQYIYYFLGNGTAPNMNSSGSGCGDHNTSDPEGRKLQAEASQWLTYLQLCAALPSLIIAAILGPMSDKLGRKVTIITPAVGALASAVISALVVYLHLPLQAFLPGPLIYGFMGSTSALLAGCFAYLTDITEPGNSRAVRMAILESCLGFAAIAGVLGGNIWLRILGVPLGFEEPFWFIAGLMAVALMYAIFGIKETCPNKEGNKICSIANASGMVHLVRYSVRTGQWKFAVILVSFFLNSGIYATAFNFQTLIVIGPPYCWTSDLLGYFQAVAAAGFVFGVLGIKLLGKCLSSYGIMQVGFLSGASSMVLQALAVYTSNRNSAMFAAAALGCLQTMPSPIMKAVMTKMVPQGQHGSLFALIACVESLAQVIFTTVWNAAFGATVLIMPGLVFLMFAGTLVICAVLIGVLQCHNPRTVYEELADENEDQHVN